MLFRSSDQARSNRFVVYKDKYVSTCQALGPERSCNDYWQEFPLTDQLLATFGSPSSYYHVGGSATKEANVPICRIINDPSDRHHQSSVIRFAIAVGKN